MERWKEKMVQKSRAEKVAGVLARIDAAKFIDDLFIIAAGETVWFTRVVNRAFVDKATELKATSFDWLRILSAIDGEGNKLEQIAREKSLAMPSVKG